MGVEEKVDRLKEGEKTAGIVTGITFLLALVKGLIGFLSGSVILMTDALHSAADSTTGFASWLGLKISQRKPNEKFPYGYYKAENLATLFISAFILYTAVELLLEGYTRLFTVSKLILPALALGTALISSAVSFFMAKYLKRTGEKINSQSLIATSQERMTDVLSSAIVFVAILLTFYKIPYVEGVLTIFISLLVLKIGLFTAKDSIFALMDISPSKEIEKIVEETISSIAGVEGFNNL
ncbi:MAG: cation diffusion facilitator family transporter, partial [Candidatus Heimdallarchaeota archaeon]